MEGFKSYLLSRQVVAEHKVVFYLHWITRFYSFANKQPGDQVAKDEIGRFLKHLSKNKEKWQVEQASEAIQLYLFYRKRRADSKTQTNAKMDTQWKSANDDMVKMLHLKHLSYRTEQSYMGWLNTFHHFCNNISPDELDGSHVKNFLTPLAVERKITASTQNLAFNAILFFYRNVLDKEIGAIAGAIRASKKRRLPVVLTKKEIDGLLEHLDGINHLMAMLIYGCGLRIRECLQLRVKNIDFERSCVTIRPESSIGIICLLVTY